MSPTAQQNLATAQRYLALLEQFAEPEAFTDILDPEIVQREFPNLLMPQGQQRGLEGMFAGMTQGQKILSQQRYDVQQAIATDEWVVLEFIWTGTLKIDVGALQAGRELKAYIATVMQFRDGRVVAQRNYDCYERFA